MPLKSWGQLADDAGEAGVGFEPLAEGTYDFKITAAEHRRSQSQKDGYNITAEVESGPHKGRKVFNTFWVSPDSPIAMGIFFRQFTALGLDKNFFKSEPSDEQIVAGLQGKRFRGTISIREWNGKKQNEVKNVDPPVGPAPASVGPAAPAAVPTPAAPAPVAAPAVPAGDPWAGSTPAAGGAWSQSPTAPAPVAAPAAPVAPPAPEPVAAPPAPPVAPAAPAAPTPPPPPPALAGSSDEPPF